MFRWRLRAHAVAAAGLASTIVVSTAVAPRAATGQDATSTAGAADDQLAILYDEGAEIYGTSCFECHMPGGVGHELDGDTALANGDTVIRQLLKGSADFTMPPFAKLSNRQLAAVATFVRNTWENSYGVVLESDVARVRAALAASRAAADVVGD